MNNMKKFFAFSIATAMVAGAVCAGTPAIQSLAGSAWWYNSKTEKYVQALEKPTPVDDYVEAPNYTPPESSGEENPGDNTGGGSGNNDPSGDIQTSEVKSITIGGYSSPIIVGHIYNLNVTATYTTGNQENLGLNEVTWVSDDPDIIDITSFGEITAHKVGKAKITATYKNTDIKNSAEITVIEDPENHAKLYFKGVDSEKGLTIKVGETIQLVAEGAEKYSPKSYKYKWGVDSESSESQEDIATVTDGRVTGKAEGQGFVYLEIMPNESSEPSPVAWALCKLEVVPADTKETTTEDESSKQNATPIDPKAPTAEAQAKQEQTPESIANYQKWLATYGGGTAAAAGTTTVSGTIGQPGSEAIVNTASGAPVAMFQSNDATNTLLAAPVGVVPSGTKIETVEAGKDSAAFKAAQNRLSSVSRRGTVQKVYGITALNADGSQITSLNGKAAMSLPLPTDVTVPAGRALKVYLIPDNGQPTKLDTLIDQGRVVFEIPKFGTFAFVVE